MARGPWPALHSGTFSSPEARARGSSAPRRQVPARGKRRERETKAFVRRGGGSEERTQRPLMTNAPSGSAVRPPNQGRGPATSTSQSPQGERRRGRGARGEGGAPGPPRPRASPGNFPSNNRPPPPAPRGWRRTPGRGGEREGDRGAASDRSSDRASGQAACEAEAVNRGDSPRAAPRRRPDLRAGPDPRPSRRAF